MGRDASLTGMIKVVADARTHKVLGVHMASYSGKNALHYIAAMMWRGLTVDELGETIEVYPDNDVLPVVAKTM